MSTETISSVHIDEIAARASCEGEEPEWLPVRNHFGIEAFGVNAFRAPRAGAHAIEDHTEAEPGDAGHEELYFVASGHARFTVDGREIDAPAGTFVYVGDPAARRVAVGEEAGTTVLAIGATPGKSFGVSDWEKRELSS
jgi:hypothetical protein